MGAALHAGGVGFRVWPPKAGAVSVAGSFNGWSALGHPWCPRATATGRWTSPGPGPGDEYKFVVRSGTGEALWRNDPYAREVTNSAGSSLVVDPAFDWGDEAGYRTPRWEPSTAGTGAARATTWW